MIKRISSEKERQQIRQESEFKKKDLKNLTDKDYKELIILIAKKLGII